jgi:hypothetical protein
MKSIRKVVYASILTLSALNFAPNLASAQEARGHFTLSHTVRWQNTSVPAGDYRFVLDRKGPSAILTLSKMDGNRGGYMLLVNDTGETTASGINKLVLLSRSTGSFVSEMDLPEYGTALYFNVPMEKSATEVAQTSTASVVASSR